MFIASIRPRDDFRENIIPELIKKGILNFRVNFARSDLNSNLDIITYIRDLERSEKVKCNIFIDLPGQNLRLGKFENGFQYLKKGDKFILDLKITELGNERRAPLKDLLLLSHVKIGDVLSTANEESNFFVTEVGNEHFICEVQEDCRLFSYCGIGNNGRYIPSSSLTQEDFDIVDNLGEWVDFICPSFVEDIRIIKQLRMKGYPNEKTKVIAKIESPVGVASIKEIMKEANGVMLCRGDLKSFYNIQQMKEIGDKMLELARASNNKLVVFATDYFSSMVNGGLLSEQERVTLQEIQHNPPNYLLVNETAKSSNWVEIVDCALRLSPGSIRED